MKQDEIIEMARQAGMELDDSFVLEKEQIWYFCKENFIAFAKLVAAKEREACIAIAESKRHAPSFALTSMPPQNGTAVDISNAIRARGEA